VTISRLYNYYLGGKDNYVVDREAAADVLRAAPEVRAMARENRAFLQRVVRFLVSEAGRYPGPLNRGHRHIRNARDSNPVASS